MATVGVKGLIFILVIVVCFVHQQKLNNRDCARPKQ